MIVIEGSDAVGKTSTIKSLREAGIICKDRSKDIISKYMLFDYRTEFRANKYYDYLKSTDDVVIFLINNDEEELRRRVLSRDTISEFDMDAGKYNELYKETFYYMQEHDMLANKLFLLDVTGMTLDEQIKYVRDFILCQV